MSGTSGPIKGKFPIATGLSSVKPQPSSLQDLTSFANPVLQSISGLQMDKAFNGLKRITEISGQWSLEQRNLFFKNVVGELFSKSAHPFSYLRTDLRQDMINRIASALAQSHLLKKYKRAVGE